jgi:hypothetical protein
MNYLLPSVNLVLPGLFLDKLGSLFLSFFLALVKSRQEIPFLSARPGNLILSSFRIKCQLFYSCSLLCSFLGINGIPSRQHSCIVHVQVIPQNLRNIYLGLNRARIFQNLNFVSQKSLSRKRHGNDLFTDKSMSSIYPINSIIFRTFSM